MTGWERLGIGGLPPGYLSGRLSPSAVLDDALAGIAALDDDLSAFVAIDAHGACRAALSRTVSNADPPHNDGLLTLAWAGVMPGVVA